MRLRDYLWFVMAVVVVITTFVLGEEDTAGGLHQCADKIAPGCRFVYKWVRYCCIGDRVYDCQVEVYKGRAATGEIREFYLRIPDECRPEDRRCFPWKISECIGKTSVEGDVTW